MSRRVRWTPGLVAEAVAKRNAGELFADMARHYGISLSQMQRVVQKKEWIRSDVVSAIDPELLRTLWAEGHSTSEIAKRLGETITKNMVIGKARRLGLPGRPSPIKRLAPGELPKPRAGRRAPPLTGQAARTRGAGSIKGATLPPLPKPTRVTPVERHHHPGTAARMPLTGPTLPSLDLAAVEVAPIKLVGRISECTYIVAGQRRSAVYCDKPTLPGKTMCPDHHAKCFVQPPRGREGFTPAIAVARMQDRGTLTAVGAAWNGVSHDDHNTQAT